jgi:hypothetical protein
MNPDITATELTKGNKFKPGLVEIDLKFNNQDYITHQKCKITKELSKQISGVGYTHASGDIFLESFCRLNESFPGVVRYSSLGHGFGGRPIHAFLHSRGKGELASNEGRGLGLGGRGSGYILN